jgi:hypothetical protein
MRMAPVMMTMGGMRSTPAAMPPMSAARLRN